MHLFRPASLALSLLFTTLVCSSFSRHKDKQPKEDPSTIYLMGEIKAFSPDSIPLGTYVALTREIVNQREHKITMKSVSIDQKGEMKEYNYIMDIKDPTFTIKDVDGKYEGNGKLHGKEWSWMSWTYSINYQDPPGRMDARNYITFVGVNVNRDFFSKDGKLQVKYHERHKLITKEQFEILYLQALKCSTK